MSTLLERLREEAKQLTEDERMAFATDLLDSCRGGDSTEVEEEWNAEILRRVEEIRSGKVEMIPFDAVMAELRSELECVRP